MTPTEAEALAARTLAAIDAHDEPWAMHDADRERIAADLAGLRDHTTSSGWCSVHDWHGCDDARRYADGLTRTARLYGVDL